MLDAHGLAVAAISVTGWVHRMDAARNAPAVRTAALGLSRTLHPARGLKSGRST